MIDGGRTEERSRTPGIAEEVDVSDSAGTASGKLAASERERGPEVQAQDLYSQRREEAALERNLPSGNLLPGQVPGEDDV